MNNDIRNLSKWLNEEQEAPIDRQALARVLAMAEQPAQQEPIWFWTHPTYGRLYKQPPAQRTWVGLTDEEKLCLEIQGGKSDVMLAELVEGWLKEKNT